MATIEEFKIKPDRLFEAVTKRAVALLPEKDRSNQKLLDVSDDVMNKYYEVARKLLDEQNWFDARDAFMFLSFLNAYVHEFWVGLGIAQQSQSKYQEALIAYTMAEATNPQDPASIANAFQCALALGENAYALFLLDKAINCCGSATENAELKEKLLSYKS